MPVTTTNFALPVPGPLDEPCDFAQQWCAFTDATQAVLDTFEAVADRTNPLVPVAKMELRTAAVVAVNSYVPYDSLIINNADMVDFDANNTTISIKRPGRFLGVSNIQFAPTNVTLTKFIISFPGGAGTIVPTLAQTYEIEITNNIHVGTNLNTVFHVTSPPYNVVVQVGNTGAVTSMTIARASFALFWYADGASP